MRGFRRRLIALDALGRALARGAIPAAGADWDAIVQLADDHGLAPALHAAWRSNDEVPPDVQDQLGARYRSNLGRTMRVRAQVRHLAHVFDAAGTEGVLLKGAAYLVTETLADPAVRVMADIDILARPSDVGSMTEALCAAGYTHHPLPFGMEHHDIAFDSPAHPALLELHRAVGTPAVAAPLPIEDVWERSRPVHVDAVQLRVLDPEDAFVHHVLHAQVQERDHDFYGVPLRQLHTSMLLERAWSDRLDTTALVRRFERVGQRPALLGHVALVRRVFGVPFLADIEVPNRVRDRARMSIWSFGLGWPTHVARNLWWALDPEYLEARYGPAGSRSRRGVRAARHVAGTAVRLRGGIVRDTTSRRA